MFLFFFAVSKDVCLRNLDKCWIIIQREGIIKYLILATVSAPSFQCDIESSSFLASLHQQILLLRRLVSLSSPKNVRELPVSYPLFYLLPSPQNNNGNNNKSKGSLAVIPNTLY